MSSDTLVSSTNARNPCAADHHESLVQQAQPRHLARIGFELLVHHRCDFEVLFEDVRTAVGEVGARTICCRPPDGFANELRSRRIGLLGPAVSSLPQLQVGVVG